MTLGGEPGDLIESRKADRKVETEDGRTLLATSVFHLKAEPVGDFRKAWATACVAAGLGRFVCDRCKQTIDGHWCEECNVETAYSGRIFHDFRPTAVRNMVRAGVPERVAMTISGHKTRSIFEPLQHREPGDLRDAMQRTQDYLKDGAERQKRPAVMQIRVAQK